MLGSIQLGFAGDVERAIEWGERGLRLSPLDPWSFVACHGMFLAHFQAGRFEQATNAAVSRSSTIPAFSISTCSWRRRSESSADRRGEDGRLARARTPARFQYRRMVRGDRSRGRRSLCSERRSARSRFTRLARQHIEDASPVSRSISASCARTGVYREILRYDRARSSDPELRRTDHLQPPPECFDHRRLIRGHCRSRHDRNALRNAG